MILPRFSIEVETRRLDRSQQAALIASREAWADAGAPEVDPDRLGTVIATGIGGVMSLLDAYDILNERGPSRISPAHGPDDDAQRPIGRVVGLEIGSPRRCAHPGQRLRVRCRGDLLGRANDPDGRADVVVAGGTEAVICPITMAGFAAMRALSTRNDDPARGIASL